MDWMTKYPENTLVYINDDGDFMKKLKQAHKQHKKIAIVFGSQSTEPEHKLFEFVEAQAVAWKDYGAFLIVDKDKCTDAAEKYEITTLPHIAFVNGDDIAFHRIVGKDYREEMNQYVVSMYAMYKI